MYSALGQSLDEIKNRNDECNPMRSRKPDPNDTSMKFFWKCSTRCLFLIGALSLCLFVSVPVSQHDHRRRLVKFKTLDTAVEEIKNELSNKKAKLENKKNYSVKTKFLEQKQEDIKKLEKVYFPDQSAAGFPWKEYNKFKNFKAMFGAFRTLVEYHKKFDKHTALKSLKFFSKQGTYGPLEFLEKLAGFPVRIYFYHDEPYASTELHTRPGTAFEVAKAVKRVSDRKLLEELHEMIMLKIIRNKILNLEGKVCGLLKMYLQNSNTMIDNINKLRGSADVAQEKVPRKHADNKFIVKVAGAATAPVEDLKKQVIDTMKQAIGAHVGWMKEDQKITVLGKGFYGIVQQFNTKKRYMDGKVLARWWDKNKDSLFEQAWDSRFETVTFLD